MRKDRGFSFIELILAAAVLAALTAVSLPRLNFSVIRKQHARTLARQLTAELRFTRSLSLTEAASNSDGYELAFTGSAPYSGWEVRSRRTGAAVHEFSIDNDAVKCSGGSRFQFSPLGSLSAGSDSSLEVASGDLAYKISVIPSTGAVLCRDK